MQGQSIRLHFHDNEVNRNIHATFFMLRKLEDTYFSNIRLKKPLITLDLIRMYGSRVGFGDANQLLFISLFISFCLRRN